MKHKFQIEGITDRKSVKLIRARLEKIPGIESVEIDVGDAEVVIHMSSHVSEHEMNEALAAIGEFHIYPLEGSDPTDDKEAHKHEHHGVRHHREGKSHEGHHEHQGGHNGHSGGGHHRMMIRDFRKRFWISAIITIPVLALSPMIQGWLGVDWQFAGSMYLLLGLSTVIYFYGGWPFLKGFAEEVKSKSPGMMTLIAMAISVAFFYSAATVLVLPGKDFFWELATLIVIMLLGHWIEMKSVLGASRALEMLVSMMPSEAHRVEEGGIVDVKLEELGIGDTVLVKPGEKVPVDGTVSEGDSYLNESLLTGESMPVAKGKGEEVLGGSVNGSGSLQVIVNRTGSESYLSRVVTMVRNAQDTKSKMQNLSDKAAKWLTFIALFVGVVTLATWLLLDKPFVFALERMVTVMVITCPHALGLAIPLVVAISTSVSAQNGLLIRNRTAFENARKISALLFDKTGTLTKGEFGVTRIESVDDAMDKETLLSYAAAVERNSEHPVGLGLVRKAMDLEIDIPDSSGFESLTGKGVKARVGEKDVMVISPGALEELGLTAPEDAFRSEAETVVFVVVDKKLAGYAALADELRPESAAAIRTFKDNGIKVYMATGDNERVAKAVSEELGLDGYYAEVLPDEKVQVVEGLQAKGEYVAMTGDGVNDAPALAQADVGIAVGSGTDVAAETADIILVKSNPSDIANLILFGKATYRKMMQNLFWAVGYNVFTIPLAAGVLYQAGFVLSPAVGAVLMSLSTVIVAINAQLLKGRLKRS